MDKSVWRRRAKIVALIDTVVICISILVLIGIVSFFGYKLLTYDATSPEYGYFSEFNLKGEVQTKPVVRVGLGWALITSYFTLAIFIIGIQIWADVSLLAAVKPEEDTENALRMARIWKRVTIAYLILSVICGFVVVLLDFFLALVWRLPSLYVVHKFIKELEISTCSVHDSKNEKVIDVIIKK